MAEVIGTNPFSKGYKYCPSEPMSDACGDGRHSECDQDFTKCHCTFRGGHTTRHAYASLTKTQMEKFVSTQAVPAAMSYLNQVATAEIEAAARQKKWDLRFLEMAFLVSRWSKDPSTKTGAVLVDRERRVVSIGYNGFARGVQDLPERYDNRDLKYKMVVHCERNSMQFANRDLTGSTLYTWPFMSCAPCAAHVINAGIVRCVAPNNDNPRWQADFAITQQMFGEAGVKLDLIDPAECGL